VRGGRREVGEGRERERERGEEGRVREGRVGEGRTGEESEESAWRECSYSPHFGLSAAHGENHTHD